MELGFNPEKAYYSGAFECDPDESCGMAEELEPWTAPDGGAFDVTAEDAAAFYAGQKFDRDHSGPDGL